MNINIIKTLFNGTFKIFKFFYGDFISLSHRTVHTQRSEESAIQRVLVQQSLLPSRKLVVQARSSNNIAIGIDIIPFYVLKKIMTFLDLKSLFSMRRVCKAWLLAVNRSKLMEINLNFSFETKFLFSNHLPEKLNMIVQENQNTQGTFQKINITISNNEDLYKLINWLTENPKLKSQIRTLNAQFFEINDNNKRKIEFLCNNLLNLCELRLGDITLTEESMVLQHPNLKILIVGSINIKKKVSFVMPSLIELKTSHIFGSIMGIFDCQTPNLESFEAEWLENVIKILDFLKLKKCRIISILSQDVILKFPEIEEFDLTEVLDCNVTLQNFPSTITDNLNSIIKYGAENVIIQED